MITDRFLNQQRKLLKPYEEGSTDLSATTGRKTGYSSFIRILRIAIISYDTKTMQTVKSHIFKNEWAVPLGRTVHFCIEKPEDEDCSDCNDHQS